MNPIITDYIQTLEIRLIQSPVVLSYEILRREIGLTDGKLRCKLHLNNGGLVECFAYVTEANGRLQTVKYSFHWQDKMGSLQERWDSAPHYPDLPNAPYHIHHEDGSVTEAVSVPDFNMFLDYLELKLNE